MQLKYFTFALLLLPFAVSAATQNSSTSDAVVAFSSEVEKEVGHDLLRVAMFIQVENSDLQTATKEVNKKINQALAVVKQQSAVNIKDNSRTTRVRYNSAGKQNGWVSRGQLVLQSKDNETLSKTIAELNGILAIEYVDSSVSSDALAELEDEMVQTAFKKFEHKAQVIQSALKAKGYKIVELNIMAPTDGRDFAPRAYSAMAKGTGFTDDIDVQLGNGKANVRARIDGRIEMIRD